MKEGGEEDPSLSDECRALTHKLKASFFPFLRLTKIARNNRNSHPIKG